MPALSNIKHEEFARNVASGMRVLEAYVAAGYTASASAASQVSKRPEVTQRILELKQEYIAEERDAAKDASDDEGEEDIDFTWVERELKKNVKEARKIGNVAASNKAIEMLIDIKGLSKKNTKEPQKPSKEPTDPDHGGEDYEAMLRKIETIASMGEEADAAPGEVDWDSLADELSGDEE